LALNRLATSTLLLVLLGSACAKKEPKPLRTEPWLAHPPAHASASSDAALPLTRYAIGGESVIRFELPTPQGAAHGTLTGVNGELSLDLGDLSRSRGQVQADLGSLALHGSEASGDVALLARARAALELSDAGSSTSRFELTSLEDLSPAQLEPAPESDAAAAFVRRARATALGTLLLHGFRVTRRAPFEAEFGFTTDRRVPSTLVIRSRTPFVISLETHAIRALDPESLRKARPGAAPRARDIRVSVELYARKVD
jgi:hypothetical protein